MGGASAGQRQSYERDGGLDGERSDRPRSGQPAPDRRRSLVPGRPGRGGDPFARRGERGAAAGERREPPANGWRSAEPAGRQAVPERERGRFSGGSAAAEPGGAAGNELGRSADRHVRRQPNQASGTGSPVAGAEQSDSVNEELPPSTAPTKRGRRPSRSTRRTAATNRRGVRGGNAEA
jgi:hypothetical protein